MDHSKFQYLRVQISSKGIVPDVTVRAFANLADVQFGAGDGAVGVGCDVMTEESLDIIVRDCTVYD